MLLHQELGRRDVVIGDGAGLELAGQERTAAVGRVADGVRPGVEALGEGVVGAARELEEHPVLIASEVLDERAVGRDEREPEVVGGQGGVAAAGVVDDVLLHQELRGGGDLDS